MSIDLRELLENNRAWAEGMLRDHPGYFSELGSQHAPQFLWIGCSDARVPANEIVGLAPGELFVHRNVANVVVDSDPNAQAVLELAVDVLSVPHIIVCGHYGCYGIECTWRRQAPPRAREWLHHVDEVATRHAALLDDGASERAVLRRLCELNVLEQARSVCRTDIAQGAWERGADLSVHAWIYSIGDGLIRELGFGVGSPDEVDASYEMALAAITEEASPPLSRS